MRALSRPIDGSRSLKMISGRRVDICHPTHETVDIVDIAHNLSMLCRFGGAVSSFYSVAEHSVNTAFLAFLEGEDVNVQMACLLHDMAEGIGWGDLIRPTKAMFPGYSRGESLALRKLMRIFDVPFGPDVRRLVEKYDATMGRIEDRQLRPQLLYADESADSEFLLECSPPADAKAAFLQAYYKLEEIRP